MKNTLVYIDETGDHSLLKIDSSYPLFGLGALIITEEEYETMKARIFSIKNEFFDNASNDFILHASELKRPFDKKSDDRNSVMADKKLRAEFYGKFNKDIIQGIQFHIATCLVFKRNMVNRYKHSLNPYNLAYENLLNRVLWHGDDYYTIFAEQRDKKLNLQLLTEHERFEKVGTKFHSPDTIQEKSSLSLIGKKDNIAGLQVIDLILSCLAREELGKRELMKGNDLNPDIVLKKYRHPIHRTVLFKDK